MAKQTALTSTRLVIKIFIIQLCHCGTGVAGLSSVILHPIVVEGVNFSEQIMIFSF